MVRSLHTPGHLALMRFLIKIRKGRGMTQAQLAKRLAQPQSYIAKIEIGERRMDVVELAEWSVATDTNPRVVMRAVAEAIRQSGADRDG